MMRISLMTHVFHTVESTDGRDAFLEAIANPWPDVVGRVTPWRGSETFAFAVRDDDGNPTHYLRFSGEEERSVPYVDGEIAFISHLIGQGVPAMRPVESANALFTERVETGLGAFHLNLFEAVPGEEPDAETLSLQQLETWGAMVARLCRAARLGS